MIIRQEQMRSFEQAAQGRFETEMLEHLKQDFPSAVAGVGDDALRRFIKQGTERAGEYGFKARGPVRMFLDFMVLLGHEFDRDPMLFWIRDILADKDGLDEIAQASRLHQHVSTYLELVYGTKGEHVAKGLDHLAKAPPQELTAVGRSFESAAAPWLQTLHARKCIYAGNAAMTNLIQEARQAAVRHNLPEPQGPPLILELMFMLGSGVISDPLFPWAAAGVSPEAAPDPTTRLERLNARAQACFRQAAENRKKT
jgi:hypothetical protein